MQMTLGLVWDGNVEALDVHGEDELSLGPGDWKFKMAVGMRGVIDVNGNTEDHGRKNSVQIL